MRRILSGVRALRQRPMKLLDSRQSCDVIGHCLKVMTPDKIRRIGRIFDRRRFLEVHEQFFFEISRNFFDILY